MTPGPPPAGDHWQRMARAWDQLGPPLRPSPADLESIRHAVEANPGPAATGRALVLGVTPEMWSLPWPPGTQVLAIDNTIGMIHSVWPGPAGTAWLGDWTHLPVATGTVSVAVCDGGFQTLEHPVGWHQLAAELARVLVADGTCTIRFFVPPEEPEPVGAVLADLVAGEVPELNSLKLRLWMALCTPELHEVALRDVWRAVVDAVPDLGALASEAGWPAEHLATLASYEDSDGRYWFADLDTIRKMFCDVPGGFVVERVEHPAYELGALCPTVVLRRTG